jgi:hypothetical protein
MNYVELARCRAIDEEETSMSGLPNVHGVGSGQGEEGLGVYKLNLSDQQLNQVADILCIEPGSDFEQQLMGGGGTVQPDDGQQLMITYRGRYVRIKYEAGQSEVIRPGTTSTSGGQ